MCAQSTLPRFRGDGTFTILQVADAHLTTLASPDTCKLLTRALDAQWPDLVVFTGDQLKGESPLFHRPDRRAQVRRALGLLLAPLERRKVPFLVTLGDHDHRLGLPPARQWAEYLAHPLCRNAMALPGPEQGSLAMPLLDSTGARACFALYLFSAHGGRSGTAPVSEAQLCWFRETRDALARQNAGHALPALAFQHMPACEYELVLAHAKPGTRGAVKRRDGAGWYTLPPRHTKAVEFLGRPPSIPATNSGQLRALAERGDVLGLYCGHDHTNSFLRRLGEVDLGATPCCGFQAEGPGVRRGIRAFRLFERDVRAYQTRVLTYEGLVGTSASHPVRDFLRTHIRPL